MVSAFGYLILGHIVDRVFDNLQPRGKAFGIAELVQHALAEAAERIHHILAYGGEL